MRVSAAHTCCTLSNLVLTAPKYSDIIHNHLLIKYERWPNTLIMMAAVEVGSWWIMALCIGIVTGETLKNCHYSRCAYRIYIYEFDCHGHGPSSVRASVHVFVCVCVVR